MHTFSQGKNITSDPFLSLMSQTGIETANASYTFASWTAFNGTWKELI